MCASYGLDPRFKDPDEILAGDEALLDSLRSWAAQNLGETLLPTGKNLRNLNPIIRERDGHPTLELAWWGYLINGQPAKFPSINTRSERLMDRDGPTPARALVPATAWFEMQKPQRQWFRFSEDTDHLFAMAAVTQKGRAADGSSYTCYSIVMRPAADPLGKTHDRTPLLIPASFVSDWLTGDAPARELMDAALAASDEILARVTATPIDARP
jgi:putative SOS response-associated peptidase YedK